MSKFRLYDIARELNITNKELMERLPGLGIEAKSHSSTIDGDEYARVKGALGAPKAKPTENTIKRPETAEADGESVLDADGNPLARKRRRRKRGSGSGGAVTEADGVKKDEPDSAPNQRRPLPEGVTRDAQGRLRRPDGTIIPPRPLPEGVTRDAQGRLVRPDGTIIPQRRPLPEGVTRDAQGRLVRPDGTIIQPRPLPEGVTRDAQGRLVRPDGTILQPRPLPEGVTRDAQGKLVRPDGTMLQPRPLPEGVTRDAQGRLVRPDGTIIPPRTGGDRPRRPLPEGVTRDAQGRLIGPDGVPLPPRPINERSERLSGERPSGDRPRRPLPEGVTRDAQGRLIGPDGAPLPPRPPRPDGERRDRPPRPDGQYGDRPPRPAGQYGDRPPRPAGQYGDRPPRPAGQYGDRPPRPAGQYGDRPSRPAGQYGDRPPRPAGQYGDRPSRPAGQYGDRPPRPAGQYGDRPPRPDGARPGFAPRPAGPGGGGRFGRPGGAAGHDKTSAKAAPAPDKSERQQNLEAKKTHKKDRPIVDKEAAAKGAKSVKGVKPAPKTSGRPAPRQAVVSLEPKTITIPSVLTLKELAEKMGISGAELVKALIKKGQMIGINNEIPYSLAADIALNYNVIAEEQVEIDIFEDTFGEAPEDESLKIMRPPVVVVMGHVDHGKTSLLDAIRDAAVTKAEHGGITQHIGAYQTSINNKPITFLDTPGHEAFTAMRMRGAQVTDIAVLVVAADDGVMPQTIEAISHAKEAGVEIIVAINKIDKPSANPDRVKQELTEYGLVTEEWGGETICAPVSAKMREGIDHLLEMIILVAEMKELKANPDKRARGVIIEAHLDRGRGPVATVLVQEGTLEVGDHIVSGATYGRVRALIDATGKRVKKAGPSTPVEILGLPDVPGAGDMFYVAKDEKQARMVADTTYAKSRYEMNKNVQKVSLGDLFNQIQAGKVKELNVIIKADVQGSVEALRTSLEKLSNEQVKIKTILGNVGAVTESDVSLASASNAIIIGFNVRPEAAAKAMAEEQNVDIRMYRVIYSAIEDIEHAMKGLLDPVFEERVLGKAEIRQIFKASGIGNIGGSYILDGKFIRNASVRIIRDGIVVFEGGLESLRRFKDDVREVNAGYECGLVFHRFNDIKTGDIVEAFVMEEIKR